MAEKVRQSLLSEDVELWDRLADPIPYALKNNNTLVVSEWAHTTFLVNEVFPRCAAHTSPPNLEKFTELVVMLFGSRTDLYTDWHHAILPPGVVEMLKATLKDLPSRRSFVSILDRATPFEAAPYPFYLKDDDAIDNDEPLWYCVQGRDGEIHSLTGMGRRLMPVMLDADVQLKLNAYKTASRRELAETILKTPNPPKQLMFEFEQPPVYAPLPPVHVDATPLPLNQSSGKLGSTTKYAASLRDSGYAAMSLLLRRIVIKNVEKNWVARVRDTVLGKPKYKTDLAVARLYADALSKLYSDINDHMERTRVFRKQFAFARLETSMLPWTLSLERQSLANINLRYGGGAGDKTTIYCSTCPDGYTTSLDGGETFPTERRELTEIDELRNTERGNSGMCVQTLYSKILSLGFTKQDLKNGPFLNWIGTWQQTQRRLERFQEDAQLRYDRGDGSFTWVTYLKRLFFLKVDVYLRWMANLSDVDDTKVTDVEEGWFKWALRKLGSLSAKAVFLGVKIIEILINSPYVVLFIQHALDAVRKDYCSKFENYLGKARMLRGKSSDEVEEYNYDSGKWLQLSKEDRIKILAKDDNIREQEQQIALDVVHSLVEDLPGLLNERLMGIASAMIGEGGPFRTMLNSLLDAFGLLPGMAPLAESLKSVLNVAFFNSFLEKATEMTIASASKEWRELERQKRNAYRLYQFFTDPFDCGDYTVTLNSRRLGGNGLSAFGIHDETHLGVAFQIMMEQAPFIVLDLLVNSEEAQAPGGSEGDDYWWTDDVAWDVAVSNYCARSFVENTRALFGESLNSYQALSRHERERDFRRKTEEEHSRFEAQRRFALEREFMATRDFELRLKIEDKLQQPRFYEVPMTMAGIGTAILGKLAREKTNLFQTSDDFTKSDGGGFTGKRVAAAAGAGVGAALVAASSYLTKHPPKVKTVVGATVVGAVAGNVAYDWLNPEGADVAEGHIYDFRHVLAVSYERDLSFRTTLRSFRDQFGGNPQTTAKPASEMDGLRRAPLERVNTILGHTKSFFLQIPEDTEHLNFISIASFLEDYRLDDRIEKEMKAEFHTNTMKEMLEKGSYLADGNGYMGLYRKAPVPGLIQLGAPKPVYVDRTTDSVSLNEVTESADKESEQPSGWKSYFRSWA